MLLTLTTTHQPATDLGYLLHKNPTRLQSFDLTFGKAHVFYPEAYRRYCWPVNSVDDLKLAPFHLLATEGQVHVDKPHDWHMEILA